MTAKAHMTVFVAICVALPSVGAYRFATNRVIARLEELSSHNESEAIWADDAANAANDINQIALQAVERACVEDLAKAYERILRSSSTEGVKNSKCKNREGDSQEGDSQEGEETRALECESLPYILKIRWKTEDELAKDNKSPPLKSRLTEIKSMIRERSFSVHRAKGLCRIRLVQPRPTAIMSCLLQHVDERRTMKRARVFSKKVQELDITEEAATALKADIQKRFELEDELEVLKHVVKNKLGAIGASLFKPQDSITSARKQELDLIKKQIKSTKFSYFHSLKSCNSELKEDTLGNSAAMLGRIAAEMNDAVTDVEKKCTEKDDLYCPEGTLADNRRGFDAMKFGKVYAGTFAVFKPSAMAVGGLVGLMVGGPPAAAAFMALAAVPGPAWVVPIPIAAAASTDWFPKCRCYPAKCEFSEALGHCAMTPGEPRSKNPFTSLPYPGQRCILKSLSKKKCELSPCQEDEYSIPMDAQNFTGSIGYFPGELAVKNCLRIKGESTQNVMAALHLPNGENNTAANRAQLYTALGVTLAPGDGSSA